MSFEGIKYRMADNWLTALPVPSGPIRYLEVGTFYGANLLSVGRTYAAHPDSRMVCIDPWADYSDYCEYKGQQDDIYETFQRNVEASGQKDKITAVRGFSHLEIPKLEDESFDIIYIDGNHEPEYACEDGVLAFRKLKVGGTIIFDDYGWCGKEGPQPGIDAFRAAYYKRINSDHPCIDTQVFIKKTR